MAINSILLFFIWRLFCLYSCCSSWSLTEDETPCEKTRQCQNGDYENFMNLCTTVYECVVRYAANDSRPSTATCCRRRSSSGEKQRCFSVSYVITRSWVATYTSHTELPDNDDHRNSISFLETHSEWTTVTVSYGIHPQRRARFVS